MYDLRYLKQIDINLTDLCNKTCSFCPRHSPEVYPNNNQHMSVELFEKVIQECLEVGYDKDILLCGRGEPATHREYKKILELLHHPDRTWKTCLTSNGYKIEEYWDLYTNNFDNIILNTYSTKEEYDERVEKYGWKLNTSGRLGDQKNQIYNLEHYYKPDMHEDGKAVSVKDVNDAKMGTPYSGFKLPSADNAWKLNFNSRCGLQDEVKENPYVTWGCTHALDFLFLNFDGKIHMCCNDWGDGGGKNQTVVGDFTKNNIFQQYRRSKKRAKINHALLNGRRHMIEACSNCDVNNKKEDAKAKKLIREEDPMLGNYLGKLMMSRQPYFRNERDLESIDRKENESQKDKTIILWSGGCDSTAALYKVLNDYDDEVIAHHINFKNHENRWQAEKESINKMLPWLRKNVRDFEYSESSIEIDLNHIGWDVMHSMYMSGVVIANEKLRKNNANEYGTTQYKRHKLILGINAEDFQSEQWDSWRLNSSNILSMMSNMQNPKESQDIPYLWQLLGKHTKQEVWNILPEFLKKNVWGCRRPLNEENKWVECGKCVTCNDLNKVRGKTNVKSNRT
jgi:7-cyano-7-deazaguanine synthase in queuosine biosynthesis/organic radical activating enzyme